MIHVLHIIRWRMPSEMELPEMRLECTTLGLVALNLWRSGTAPKKK